MKKNLFTIGILLLVVGIIYISSFSGGNKKFENGENIQVRDGIQYIHISALGGYAPKVNKAKAGIPTKLVMETKNTFDCSASFKIPEMGYQKILPQNSSTEIDLGTKSAGEKITGLCSMGMYSFSVEFI